ncbi:MAG: DMT family transporter [Bacteroidales bacterium]|nr:DMT family transporter [Bacteroidales bacterium]
MNSKIQGTICGMLAAICYGMNPLGALFLYADGYNVNTVLFYRYSLAVLILAVILLLKRESFRLNAFEFKIVAVLGCLFAASSLTFYNSFKLMDAGISCTMLFAYPIMVAVIMAVCYKEKIHWQTVVSVTLAVIGISLLYKGDGSATISFLGTVFVMISALTYAVYIVVINRSQIKMSSYKMTFYVLLFCSSIVSVYSLFSQNLHIQMLSSVRALGFAVLLAVVPTLLSLVLMAVAVKKIGSTPTAIMGALEPITAVIVGVVVFDEAFTLTLAVGIILILSAVFLIVLKTRNKS